MSNVKNRFIHNSKEQSKDIDVLIISSRPQYRQKSRGCLSLIQHEKNPIIDIQLKNINSYIPNSAKYISIGFDCNKFIKYRPEKIRILENVLFEETNIVEDIRLFFNNSLNSNLLLIMGNTIFDKSILTKIKINTSSIFYCNHGEEDPKILRSDNSLIRMNYEKSIEDIWSGICYFTGHEYKILKRFCSKKNNNKLFMECINHILDNGGKFETLDGKVIKV